MKKMINPHFCLFLKILFKTVFLILFCALFCACIGISMDITIRPDGSGSMVLEYKVSRLAESLGKLDGNERWNTIPVGRADFERSMARLPRLSLASFSSSDNGTDVITRAEITYKNPEDILAFLEPSKDGGRASFKKENGKNSLFLLIAEANQNISADAVSLANHAFSGYSLNFSLNVPGTAALAVTDAAGVKISNPPKSIQIIPQGKKVSVTMDTAELFNLTDGLGLEFSW